MNRHWLFLRGLGRDQRHWGTFIEQFQQAFIDDKVSVLDTCGNGFYSDFKSPLSIAEYTDHCRISLGTMESKNATKQSAKLNLVALSLGGMIALDWACRFPHEVQSITLINTSAANLTPWHKRINLFAVFKSFMAIIGQCSDISIEKAILQLTSNQQACEKTIVRWAAYRGIQSTSLLNLLRQLIAASRFKASALESIKPLVLTSKKDRLVNHVASKDIHQFFGGTLIEHDKAGHDLPLDDADWVIAQIKCHIVLS